MAQGAEVAVVVFDAVVVVVVVDVGVVVVFPVVSAPVSVGVSASVLLAVHPIRARSVKHRRISALQVQQLARPG